MRNIKAKLKAMSELWDTWYCNYCHSGYNTYAEMSACMSACLARKNG